MRIRRRALAAGWGVVLVLGSSSPALAQAIAVRVNAVRDGQVRMTFAARPGVCGNGRNISMRWQYDDWESYCEPGPVRVALDMRDGTPANAHTYVGGRWRSRAEPVTDLGVVSAPEAARYFLTIAHTAPGRAGSDAVLAATLADSVTVWPDLLDLARDRRVPNETRRSAVFWVGQAAGDAAVDGLTDLLTRDDQDLAVKEQAIFALSQLRNGGGVEPLIGIARSHPNPRLRKRAIFWLAQSNDPRALALFEELLIRK